MADKKNDKYLSLYPEDFEEISIWSEICEVLNISMSISEVRIYFGEDDIVVLGE